MEEAFKREKEEADRLLREQRLEYESKIVELQKQVMETSMSQSMLSSILSSSGFVDTSSFKQNAFQPDYNDIDTDTVNCKNSWALIDTNEYLISVFRLFLVRTRLSISLVGVEKMALSPNDIIKGIFQFLRI